MQILTSELEANKKLKEYLEGCLNAIEVSRKNTRAEVYPEEEINYLMEAIEKTDMYSDT